MLELSNGGVRSISLLTVVAVGAKAGLAFKATMLRYIPFFSICMLAAQFC